MTQIYEPAVRCNGKRELESTVRLSRQAAASIQDLRSCLSQLCGRSRTDRAARTATPTANYFIRDVKTALPTACSSPGMDTKPYLNAVENAFGMDVDYTMFVKPYSEDASARRGSPERHYSPAQVIGARYQRIQGAPIEASEPKPGKRGPYKKRAAA
jgi:hypothetical protein